MIRRRLVGLAAFGMAACTSGGGAEDTVPETVAQTTTATTTAGTTTSTTLATTTTAPTTSTTVAPTTTLDPIAEIDAAVKQARLDGEAAIDAAGRDPTDDAFREDVARFNTGPRLEETTAFLDQLAADGLAFRQDDAMPTFIEFEGDIELPDGTDSTEAFLVECRVDTDVVYVVQDDPDAPEIIVDDLVVAFRARVRYVLEDGQWRNSSGEMLTRTEGDPTCA